MRALELFFPDRYLQYELPEGQLGDPLLTARPMHFLDCHICLCHIVECFSGLTVLAEKKETYTTEPWAPEDRYWMF